MTYFQEKVLKIVSGIPTGHTLTYKEVAASAGWPRAYRAVGNVLNKNYDLAIPCHRVIRSDDRFGGYNRGKLKKIQLLEAEKIRL